MKRFALVCCAFAVATGCGRSTHSAGTATSSSSTTRPSIARSTAPVDGRWVNPTAAVTVGTTGGVIEQRSGTIWTGDLDGKTTYTASFRADPKHAGAYVGTIDEVFDGSMRGVGRGRLFLTESFTVSATGAVVNVGRIVRGDGGLKGVGGRLRFTGTSDLRGIGQGTFTGALSH
jgi:hypothetical protein